MYLLCKNPLYILIQLYNLIRNKFNSLIDNVAESLDVLMVTETKLISACRTPNFLFQIIRHLRDLIEIRLVGE